MPHDPYRALYIHIPFCVSRCAYCDFHTQACKKDDPQITDYVDGLCLQLRRLAKAGELGAIETIYIGGGTPTFIGHGPLTQLLYTISLSINLENVKEFTVEANPESLTEALVKDMYALGVDRLSLGVQSFDDDVLRALGRAHTAQGARDAIALAKTRFTNVSIDLMCGIPGQSDETFAASLEEALTQDVTHVSIYPLTVELGTPLADAVAKELMDEPDDDVQARHMQLAAKLLCEGGFERYEVANYAKPGFASKHNTSYWQGVPYLGLGESAATMTQNAERRMRKTDDLITDDLNPAQMAAEDLMLGMRLTAGVPIARVEAAKPLLPGVQECFDELCELGLVAKTDTAYVPTEEGWLCGNELYGRIFDLA